jgi:hypothetical protein
MDKGTVFKENKCSKSLAIKEMQIKTSLRVYFTPVRMTVINNKMLERIWGKGSPYILFVVM